MYNRTIIIESLQNIERVLQELTGWTLHIRSASDFSTSTEGIILLNAVCMRLFAVGEELKAIDKRTDKTLLPLYPDVDWRRAMKMRDIIGHHYFEINAGVIFDTLRDDIPTLLEVIRQIKTDISNNHCPAGKPATHNSSFIIHN
ncbi:MAG: DUF86 domain-containing protein [Prevotellaceae bacterium]|jgi:uncharacterized protein with HEPN domain|nr:DUF86 domain-containing protein [Prevotellaceae bacterium]